MDGEKPLVDELKDADLEYLRTTRDFGMEQASTLFTLIIAAVFGIFSILLIIQGGPKPDIGHGRLEFPLPWVIFSITYLAVGMLTMVLFGIAMMFARLTTLSVRMIAEKSPETSRLAGKMFREAGTGAGSNWLTRLVFKTTMRGGPPRYPLGGVLGLILFVAMWVAVSFL
jgi:hypothetical protein